MPSPERPRQPQMVSLERSVESEHARRSVHYSGDAKRIRCCREERRRKRNVNPLQARSQLAIERPGVAWSQMDRARARKPGARCADDIVRPIRRLASDRSGHFTRK